MIFRGNRCSQSDKIRDAGRGFAIDLHNYLEFAISFIECHDFTESNGVKEREPEPAASH